MYKVVTYYNDNRVGRRGGCGGGRGGQDSHGVVDQARETCFICDSKDLLKADCLLRS